MPFKRGLMPERRTLEYLNKGTIRLRRQVKILAMSVNYKLDSHAGARDFYFWHWGQVLFKNPDVQMFRMRDFTPSAFFMAILDTGKEVVIDIEGLPREQIYQRLQRTLGKTPLVDKIEKLMEEEARNPANIGKDCHRHCICEVEGQHPCPGMLPAPDYMKGKWRWNKNLV